MEEKFANLSINLAGENFKEGIPSVADFLTKELKEDLRGKEYYEFGEGDTRCLVLAKPLIATYHEKGQGIDADIEKYTESYLIFAKNKNNNPIPRTLVFNLQMLTENAYLNNPEPLNDFKSLLKNENEKEIQACRYQILPQYEIFAYNTWSVSTQIKRDISGKDMLKVKEQKDLFLKETDRIEYEQFMRENQKPQPTETLPVAA